MKLVKVKPKPSVFPFLKIVDTVTEDNLETYRNFGRTLYGSEKLQVGDYLVIGYFRGEEDYVLAAINPNLEPREKWLCSVEKGEVLTKEGIFIYKNSLPNTTLDAVIVETKEDENIIKLFLDSYVKAKKGHVIVSGQSDFKLVFTQKEFEEKFDVAA